jgi:hypothetical protein
VEGGESRWRRAGEACQIHEIGLLGRPSHEQKRLASGEKLNMTISVKLHRRCRPCRDQVPYSLRTPSH